MKLHKTHHKVTAMLGAAIALVISIYGLYTGITQWNPPEFFPLNDPDAIYTVVKTDAFYSINYRTSANNHKTTYCDVNNWGQKINCRDELVKNFTIYVASSPIQLEPLVNQEVSVKGSFTYTNKQCIQKQCTPLGEYAGLDISAIEKK